MVIQQDSLVGSFFHYIVKSRVISTTLILANLFWLTGFPLALFSTAHAATLAIVQDTIVDSSPSAATNHVVTFQATTTVTAGQTIEVQFDPVGDLFGLGSLVVGDLSFSGATLVGACGGGLDEVTASVDQTAPLERVIFTVCAGDSVTGGLKTITIGNSHVTNPAAEGSYIVRTLWGPSDSGDTQVAIINKVTVTASVDTNLIFSILGVANGQTINGDGSTTTATTTTATTMPFGTLASGSPKILAQDLFVTTNATNGFTVTVRQNQNLTSSTGADIDVFSNGNGNPTPIAWVLPSATLGSENTYGHYGISSEDADLNGNEFNTALYAGNFATTSRAIFHNGGPADGVTANVGRTRVGIKVEVTSLQEAGSDYTNQLTYVCTPLF